MQIQPNLQHWHINYRQARIITLDYVRVSTSDVWHTVSTAVGFMIYHTVMVLSNVCFSCHDLSTNFDEMKTACDLPVTCAWGTIRQSDCRTWRINNSTYIFTYGESTLSTYLSLHYILFYFRIAFPPPASILIETSDLGRRSLGLSSELGCSTTEELAGRAVPVLVRPTTGG